MRFALSPKPDFNIGLRFWHSTLYFYIKLNHHPDSGKSNLHTLFHRWPPNQSELRDLSSIIHVWRLSNRYLIPFSLPIRFQRGMVTLMAPLNVQIICRNILIVQAFWSRRNKRFARCRLLLVSSVFAICSCCIVTIARYTRKYFFCIIWANLSVNLIF